MAHFIGYLRGTRGEASRLGGKDHGIQTRVQGWRSGVKVIARHIDFDDRFEIYMTGGSDGAAREKLIAVVNHDKNDKPFVMLPNGDPVLAALENLLECIGACQIAPGALERADRRESVNAAVAKARKVINENCPEKVGTSKGSQGSGGPR